MSSNLNVHGKIDFVEVSKNLARCRSENNFNGHYQNSMKHDK